MKKKIGPLPLWAWIAVVGGAVGIFLLYKSNSSGSSSSTANANTVDPSSPTGLTYGQEAQDSALGTDPATGETYAQEQAASSADDSSGGGTAGSTDTGTTTDDSAELGQIDSDIQVLNSNLLAGQGLQDADPNAGQTFGGEISDVVGGITALKAAGLIGAAAPATATKSSSTAPALAKGAERAPFGAVKPKAPAGYTAVGQGNGFWEFVPIVKTVVKSAAPKPSGSSKTEPKSTVVSGTKRKGP